MIRRNWTRDELIIAFNLYCKIPFGKLRSSNKDVIEIASIIDRTPNAVALKLVNFASLDPYHKARGVKGMKNSGKLDKVIYNEFTDNWNKLVYESEILIEKYKENSKTDIQNEISEQTTKLEGEEIERLVKTRVNQTFFRKAILANYNSKCAISNISIPELLIASHIIPWSLNEVERLNPQNGICLSPLYDKLFDRGFMSFTDNYEIIFSEKILKISDENVYNNFFGKYSKQKMTLPEKFTPKVDFIQYHRNFIFQK